MQNKNWMVADTLEYGLLKENAKSNRKFMTEAERVFWSMAKGHGFKEKCRRQYVIGGYIVDFFFRKSMLVVEIDGGYHFTEEQQKEDAIRQNWLEHQGYRVIRFKNEEVLNEPQGVYEKINKLLTEYPISRMGHLPLREDGRVL